VKFPTYPDGAPIELSDEHRHLAGMLQSYGWESVMKVIIAEKVKGLYVRLLDPTKKRKEEVPDDFIRGEIAALKWIIEWPEKEMAQVARRIREAEEQNHEAPTAS